MNDPIADAMLRNQARAQDMVLKALGLPSPRCLSARSDTLATRSPIGTDAKMYRIECGSSTYALWVSSDGGDCVLMEKRTDGINGRWRIVGSDQMPEGYHTTEIKDLVASLTGHHPDAIDIY